MRSVQTIGVPAEPLAGCRRRCGGGRAENAHRTRATPLRQSLARSNG